PNTCKNSSSARSRNGRSRSRPQAWWRSEKKLLPRGLLVALEVAEAGAVGLVVEELLHAFLAAAFLVVELERIALGVEIVLRLRLVHEAHGADRLLGVAQCGRTLLHQLLGELD